MYPPGCSPLSDPSPPSGLCTLVGTLELGESHSGAALNQGFKPHANESRLLFYSRIPARKHQQFVINMQCRSHAYRYICMRCVLQRGTGVLSWGETRGRALQKFWLIEHFVRARCAVHGSTGTGGRSRVAVSRDAPRESQIAALLRGGGPGGLPRPSGALQPAAWAGDPGLVSDDQSRSPAGRTGAGGLHGAGAGECSRQVKRSG